MQDRISKKMMDYKEEKCISRIPYLVIGSYFELIFQGKGEKAEKSSISNSF